jgi:hypothetical protein
LYEVDELEQEVAASKDTAKDTHKASGMEGM